MAKPGFPRKPKNKPIDLSRLKDPQDKLKDLSILDVKIPKEEHKNLEYVGDTRTLYKDSHPALVKKLMEAGCTQFEVAEHLGIKEVTLYNWANKHPEFKAALRAGAEMADNRVELSLFSKAVGYKWIEEVKSKTFNEVGEEVEEVTQVTKQLPPDNSAMFFWLKNRRAHRWKDKHEVTINQNVHIVSSNDLNQLVHQSIIDGEYTVVETGKDS